MGNTVSRITNTGNYLVNGSFDEWTGAPVVDNSLLMWLDPGQPTSYNGNGTTWTDLSGKGYSGTLINNPTFSDTTGFTLNGSNQYVNVPAITSSMLANGFTWAGWVKTTAFASSWMWPFSTSTGNWLQLGKISGTGGIRFDSAGTFYTGGSLDATGVNIADGNWHYLVGTWDTQNRYIYFDGTFQVSTASTPGTNQSAWGNMILGCHPGPAEFWNGQLGIMKIYNRALSATEIQKNYNALAPRYGLTPIANVSSQIRTTTSAVLSSVLDEITFNTVEALIVAGGGGGGGATGGGGGAGGLLYSSNIPVLSNTSYTIVVGSGGLGGAGNNGAQVNSSINGANTVAFGLTAVGGGAGGCPSNGNPGGSGGGGSYAPGVGGSGTSGQGNSGGNGNWGGTNPPDYTTGGGGGAGAAGSNATPTSSANGGIGLSFSISGTPTYYAGGGGGGADQSRGSNSGLGGLGGGGNGAGGQIVSYGPSTAGTPGTGGGGGGGSNSNPNANGASGGSGTVIIRYAGAQTATGGNVSTSNGYTIHTFTSNGTFTTSKFPAKRELTTGTIQVAGNFDEWTGAPIADSSLKLWLDAGQPASYPRSGTTWTDLSGNGNNGTLINSPTYSSQNGGALTFNGSNNYVSLNQSNLSFTNNFSTEIWYQSNNNTPQLFRGGTSNQAYTILGYIAGTWKVTKYGIIDIYIGTVPTDTKWHQVVVTYSSTNGVVVYVDGTVNGTSSDISNVATMSTNCTLGEAEYGYMNGQISKFVTYNRVLSASEVSQNFNALRGRYGI